MSQHSDGISKTSLAKAIGYDCKWNYISTSGSSRGYKGKHDINPPSLAAQVFSWSINQLTVLAAIFVATFLSDIRSGELTFEIEFELQNELELKQENGLLKKESARITCQRGLAIHLAACDQAHCSSPECEKHWQHNLLHNLLHNIQHNSMHNGAQCHTQWSTIWGVFKILLPWTCPSLLHCIAWCCKS